MSKKLKHLFSGIDSTVFGYVFAGMLLMISVADVFTGHYFRAFNSFLYTFIMFCAIKIIKENKHLKRLLVLQHLIIEALEENAGNRHNETSDHPEPPTFEESQGEKKED